MSLTNEDLLAISQLLDVKLKPIEERTKNIEILLENDILPRLQNIESCYTATYRKYSNELNQFEVMQADINIIKKVVAEYSEKSQEIS